MFSLPFGNETTYRLLVWERFATVSGLGDIEELDRFHTGLSLVS